MLTCIIRFIFGGMLMASVYLISLRSTAFAGVVAALPIFSGFSFVLYAFNKNCDVSKLLDMSRGSVVGMLIGAAFYGLMCGVLSLISRLAH